MLAGVKFQKASAISLFALLPDLDALFFVHRSLSHSALIMSIVIAPFLLLTYKFKPSFRSYAWLVLMVIISHPILDVFTGYTPILWPLYSHSVWIKTELVAQIGSSLSLTSRVKLLTKPTTFQTFQGLDAPLFTGGTLVASVVLLSPVLLKFSKIAWERLKELLTR